MEKYLEIADILRNRILHGDYMLKEIPTENKLAAEVGVSRMTARKAIMLLISQGVLERKENRRVVCVAGAGRKNEKIALLVPTWSSTEYQTWRHLLERMALEHNLNVHPVDYVHWEDPVVPHTLDSFPAVFLLPSVGALPPRVAELLRSHPRLAVLGNDLSSHGLLSINLFPAIHVNRLLDLLVDAGCHRVDCLCAQPRDEMTEARVMQWRLWQRLTGIPGDLLTRDVRPFSLSIRNAFEMVDEALRQGRRMDGILSVTMNGALGACRACREHGLRIGRDVRICTVNGQGTNRYTIPTINCLEPEEQSAYLKVVFSWMTQEQGAWDGPLVLQPELPKLFTGESTSGM